MRGSEQGVAGLDGGDAVRFDGVDADGLALDDGDVGGLAEGGVGDADEVAEGVDARDPDGFVVVGWVFGELGDGVPALVPGAEGGVEGAVVAEALGVTGPLGDAHCFVDFEDEGFDDPAVHLAEFEELVCVGVIKQ